MFSRVTDASKVALAHLVVKLKQGGFRLLDTQFVTEHLQRFGATEISRARYRRLLAEALEANARFPVEVLSGADVARALRMPVAVP
jgi:leucyl/phenylalanyl-tRNA--protein transferase